MNQYFDVVSFAISLAVNMFLIGSLICAGIAAGFRLIPNLAPRARYVISVIAFLIAMFVPLLAALGGVSKQVTFIKDAAQAEQKIPGETNSFINTTGGEKFLQNKPDETTSPQLGLLENFVVSASGSSWGGFFLAIWLVISILFLLREMNGHRNLKKARRAWQRTTDAERREVSCSDDIALYFDDQETPCSVGLLHPVIVLPRNFPDDLSATAIRSVIRHETAHVRWRDPLANFLLRLIRSLFWINPALWYLEYTAKFEQEAAADCEALQLFSRPTVAGNETIEYANLLLSIAKISRQRNLTATHLGGSSLLENRIHRILNGYSETSRIRILLSATIFLMVISAMTFVPVASKPLKAIDTEFTENESSKYTGQVISDSSGQNSINQLQKTIDTADEKTSRVERFLDNSEGESKTFSKAENLAKRNRSETISSVNSSAQQTEQTSGEINHETRANDFVYSGSFKYKYTESNVSNNVIKPDINLTYKQDNKFNFQADK